MLSVKNVNSNTTLSLLEPASYEYGRIQNFYNHNYIFLSFLEQIVPQEGETPNNMVSLVARPGTTSSYRSYIGNSALHRIHKEGEITKWSFYAKDHGTTGLQIWRPRPDLGPEKYANITSS